MRHWIHPLLIVTVLAGSGIAHGLMTDRWGMPDAVHATAERLAGIPAEIRGWSSDEVPVSQRELNAAGAVGHLSRSYVNRADGTTVNVLVLCGRPGPMSVHPPTICFTGAGWRLLGAPVKSPEKAADGRRLAEFWRADFDRGAGGAPPQRIRAYWAWSVDGDWEAADAPRMQYAGRPHLYKAYLTLDTSGREKEAAEQAALEFMRLFLAEAETALFFDTAR